MKTKTFDCVDMKRRGAEKVQKELAGMTPEEELAFWQKGTEELRQHQNQLQQSQLQQSQLRAVRELETMPLPGTAPTGRRGSSPQNLDRD